MCEKSFLRGSNGDAEVLGVFDNGTLKKCNSISPYLVPGDPTYVTAQKSPISENLSLIASGSMPRDGGNLLMTNQEKQELVTKWPEAQDFCRRYSGTSELTNGTVRWCLWVVLYVLLSSS